LVVPDSLLVVVFLGGAALGLGSSWVLVSRLERVGARLGLSELLLGVVAAVAADSPEITAAVTAIGQHQSQMGAGVVIGSNVFNLAALLGVAAIVARGIVLHRGVVLLEGVVALWVASVCVSVVVGLVPAPAGLALVLAWLVPYLVVLGVRQSRLSRLGLPANWVRWLANTLVEEELELGPAAGSQFAGSRDAVVAVAALLLVIGASVAMEQAVSRIGQRHAIPGIVLGGVILAGVTSLPNAVAAVYLAARGRGAATLSTAMNSNALNVTVGLLLPATVVGVSAASGPATLAAGWYLGLTAFALVTAYLARGLWRAHGALIVSSYLAFGGVVVSTAYDSGVGLLLSVVAPPVAVLAAARCLRRGFNLRTGRALGRGELQRTQRALNGAFAAPTATGGSEPTVCASNGKVPGYTRGDSESLVGGWSINRVWCLALVISFLIAVTDGVLGRHVILIGLLIAGPCCALVTGRWVRVAVAGTTAAALAIVLGLPDGIWGTSTHLVLLGAVVAVAIGSTAAAVGIERHR
jgi:cation:H+ antiporter